MQTINATTLISLIDLTTLSASDDPTVITALCQKAKRFKVAAVCIYPQFIPLAKSLLANSAIKIATVANFPCGDTPITEVSSQIKQAISDGADEIDVVMPYRTYQQGQQQTVTDFIAICRQACGSHVLMKVIFETETWQDPLQLANACQDVILAGADFLKTSTGKLPIGATLEASAILLKAIANHRTRAIGFKAAGGIRTLTQVWAMVELAQSYRLPIDATRLRLGASRLLELLEPSIES